MFSSLPLSLSRLWSSWIPNSSRCSTWSGRTGTNGRSWTRRDNVVRACLRPPARAASTAQTPAAAPGPQPAARPAAAGGTPTARHPNLLVSFCRHLRVDVLSFFPLKCSLQQRQCSAVHAEVVGLCSSSLLLLEMSFRLERGAIIEVFLLPSVFPRAEGWRSCDRLACRSSHESADDTVSERKLKALGQHVNQWANSNYSGHCTHFLHKKAWRISQRNIGPLPWLVFSLPAPGTSLLLTFCPEVTEICFFVNLYIGSWVKCCLKRLWIVWL